MMDDANPNVEPSERFSKRVELYDQFRPHYARAVIPFLQEAIALSPETVVADIGAGTGILSDLFLQSGNIVHAVEPNEAMRAAAEAKFADEARFHSVPAAAEETTLPENSIDLIVAGQAFHWFKVQEARREFARILKPEGWVALIYNSWNLPDSAVADAYRQVIDNYGIDYRRVSCQQRIGDDMSELFGPAGYKEERFENPQNYDFEAFSGRAFSSSYSPLPGHPNYEPMKAALRELFEQHAVDGRLVFPYETAIYWGRVAINEK